MHGLASWVADQLPLQTLFSYLGEGYYVVLGGYGFGGLVAHALAVRLVINVRNEINMAKQMGINLSALAQTEGKVRSPVVGDVASPIGSGRGRRRVRPPPSLLPPRALIASRSVSRVKADGAAQGQARWSFTPRCRRRPSVPSASLACEPCRA